MAPPPRVQLRAGRSGADRRCGARQSSATAGAGVSCSSRCRDDPLMSAVRMRVAAVIVALVTSSCDADDLCQEVGADTVKCSLAVLDVDRINSTRPDLVRSVEIVCSDRSYANDQSDLSFLRVFPGLESLTLRHCNFGKIRSGLFEQLRGLKELSIRTYKSQWFSDELHLEDGCFRSMENLESLDISENNLSYMEPDALKQSVLLKVLNLSGNNFMQLGSLQEAGISPNLQVLDMSHNGVTELRPSDLSSFPHLRDVSLKSNGLSLIQDGALGPLSMLERLDISDNLLDALPPMMLNETRGLQHLLVQNNSVRVLPPGLLADLPHLVTVNMSFNKLSSQWIRKDTFARLFRLIVLDLSANMLDTFNQDVFEDLSSLQVLDIGHNRLQTLSERLFASLSNLHTLTLSGNGLSRLEQRSFEGLHVLNRLSLDHNRLADMDEQVFFNVSGVQHLQLQNNELTRLPVALDRLASLHRLDLADNHITGDTHGVLKSLQHLGFLSLAGNQLHNVSADFMANQTSLSMLDLSRNEIVNVESGAFDSSSGLRAIRLDSNQLKNINGLFAKLPKLLWLNVSDNQIEFFDYALIPAELRWLDLHQNKLRDIGNFYNIESKIRLETLDLSHNQISLISKSSVPDAIKYFIMSSNQLTTVEPGTFEAKWQLVRADLSSNQLSELDLKAVTLSSNGSQEADAGLMLAGNPFFCTCAMDWLLTINSMTPSHKYPKVLDGGRIMCRLLQAPNRLTPLRRTKPADFLCTYDRHCFALCHCCNYVACDCEMKCPDGCSCYHDHTWNTNIVDCSSREQLTISREIPMDATAVFADGNNIHSLKSHTFIGRKRIRHLYVNNSNVAEIQNRSLNGLSSMQVLRLENNALTELRGFEFDGLLSLRELYLHDNRIATMHPSTFARLAALEVLSLHHNRLTTFPVWQLTASPYLVQLSLGQNPWSCACMPAGRLADFIRDQRAKVDDADQVRCSARPLQCGAARSPPAVRRVGSDSALPFILLVVGALAAAALVAGLVFRFRARLCPPKVPNTPPPPAYGVAVVAAPAGTLYDVFVTYSAQDTRFVNEVLAPELEQAAPALRLCLLRRDAPSTSYLGDAVHHCVTASRKTLLVVSRNFLDNEWCRFDFKASHLDALRQSGDIVVLLYGVERDAVEGELRALLKGAACIAYGEPDFWRKLRDLLPQVRAQTSTSLLSMSTRRHLVHVRRKEDCPERAGGAIATGGCSSPTCSTVLSDDGSDSRPYGGRPGGCAHGPLDPGRLLGAQSLHGSSYSSSQPSEHTYTSIDQYQSVPVPVHHLLTEPQLYCTPEPDVQPQMPSDTQHPGHYQQRSLGADSHHPSHGHQRPCQDHPGQRHPWSPHADPRDLDHARQWCDPDHPDHGQQRSMCSDLRYSDHYHHRSLDSERRASVHRHQNSDPVSRGQCRQSADPSTRSRHNQSADAGRPDSAPQNSPLRSLWV